MKIHRRTTSKKSLKINDEVILSPTVNGWKLSYQDGTVIYDRIDEVLCVSIENVHFVWMLENRNCSRLRLIKISDGCYRGAQDIGVFALNHLVYDVNFCITYQEETYWFRYERDTFCKREKEECYHLEVKKNDPLHRNDPTHQFFACARDCAIHENVTLPNGRQGSFGVTIPYWWLYAPITLQYYGDFDHEIKDHTYRT